ncbi:hypothetical protein [Microbacterium cremeum]|uniref:hypothetical protein n=1 Tax=Microbacterium cremeum TaxID=2782169 RepID=UPI001886AB6C|nr:hypothetical protein [Microbacterium cremeum]
MAGAWKADVRALARGAVAAIAMTGLFVGGMAAGAQPAAASAASAGALATSADVPAAVGGVADAGVVKAADLSKFQPGNIISDAVFFNKSTMTEAQIQSFLQSKVPSCKAGYICLKDWYDTSRTTNADAMCGAYSGGVRERASRIIYKVAQACGINPQVILATLQKEQGLVTHVWPSDWRYTIAMGQGCPDTAACDTRYYGFFNQVFGAAWQLKRYANPPGTSQYFTWFAPGKTWNVRWHPNAACGSSPVYIQNQATANLYYYTPYQPNAAAIRAGYAASTDPCSSYGNRNFYNYFTDWFGSTQNGPDPCTQPATAMPAVKTYVVTATVLNGRLAPSVACERGVVALEQGTVLQAVAVDDRWLKVHHEAGDRWVHRDYLRYATAQESACALPGGVASAKYAYVVDSESTLLRAVPDSDCGTGSETADEGTILQATAVSSDRLWVKVNAGAIGRWVVRSDLRRATDAESPCARPGGVAPAKLHYLIPASGVTGRLAPSADCGFGVVTLSGGTAVQAIQTSSARDWLLVSTGRGEVWIDRRGVTQLTSTAPCDLVVPERAAKRTYVIVEGGAVARTAPLTSCGAGSTALSAGTVVSPTASTSAGDWLRVRLLGGDRWVARSTVRAATQEEACQPPAETKTARYTYVLEVASTGRSAPQSDCAISSTTIPAGTIADATAVTMAGDWLLLRVSGGDRWVLRAHTSRYTGG